jgi:hypothetical protein
MIQSRIIYIGKRIPKELTKAGWIEVFSHALKYGYLDVPARSKERKEAVNAVITKHALDFYSAPWESWLTPEFCAEFGIKDDDEFPGIEWKMFRVGTCEGQYRVTPESYELLSIINSSPGNGHLDDALEWFEWAANKSKLPLRILRFTNERFKKHMIEKRGYHVFGKEDVEK